MEKWYASYRHRYHDYHVRFLAGKSSPLPADWHIENLVPSKGPDLGPTKRGSEFRHGVSLDPDGDGEFDEATDVFTYDLLFKHDKHNGSIWMSTIALPGPMRERDLRVLLRDYLESVSTSGVVSIGLDDAMRDGDDKPYVTRVRGEARNNLDGRAGRAVVFDVAKAEDLRLSEDVRWERAKVVIVRPPFAWSNRDAPSGGDIVSARSDVPFYPVILVVGYVNDAQEFARGRRDFERLLARMKIGTMVKFAPHRKAVLECEPKQKRVTLEVLVDGDGKPAAVQKYPNSTPSALQCVKKALSSVEFPKTGAPRMYVHQFARRTPSKNRKASKPKPKAKPKPKPKRKPKPKPAPKKDAPVLGNPYAT